MSDVVTAAELEAFDMMVRLRGYRTTTDGSPEIHRAADEIIALAERIKAQRATVAMVLR